jgi:hypothetical protein
MHLREDLKDTDDVCVAGNRILLIQNISRQILTIFKPGNLTEVEKQYPIIGFKKKLVISTEKFAVIGNFNSYIKDCPYTLCIFDVRDFNKPPSEVKILGLYNSYIHSGSFVPYFLGPNIYNNDVPPPTAIVGDYLLVLRVRNADGKGTDLRTILRYNLRKIPSLWTQDEQAM